MRREREDELSVLAKRMLGPTISFLRASGLSADELRALLEELLTRAPGPRFGARPRPHQRIGAETISRWYRDPRFTGPDGRPRTLKLQGRDSFAGLVRTVATGASPKTVLETLKRLRIVAINRQGEVELLERFYQASSGETYEFAPLARQVADFVSTVEYNALRKKKPRAGRFQRMADTTQLDPSALPAFDRYIRRVGQEFLEAADEWLARHAVSREPGVRAGVGVFTVHGDRITAAPRSPRSTKKRRKSSTV